ncbi:MAG: phosphoribosyl-ATP pyrophosphohydrolase/phosphoribosyl-AMP cyclohydrolase [Candidatus Krumholzibacteriia bacterium]|jgi:phosphoribosyl-ATP pyrophosphohydrolase/phosphoribosyl-AMP cyclohydrolase
MLIPSIDLQGGQAVQLKQGKTLVLEAGDPRPLLEKFSRVGEVAVIDLDAALGVGNNRDLIRELVTMAPCRVGGGIRDAQTAIEWLDAGASKVIIGTAAVPEVLRELPRERVIAALDTWQNEVVVEGWTRNTGRTVADYLTEIRELVSGILVTFVEQEGRLQGFDLERVPPLLEVAGNLDVTVAGGVTTLEELATLDQMGVDAQVGMSIYTGRLDLADAYAAPLVSDRPDGLWPTVVVDESGQSLGLVYSSAASLRLALAEGRGIYWSRRRGLWRKGETSGHTQELLKVETDCDRDALRFTVRQTGGGFCHLGTQSCWGNEQGLGELARRLDGLRHNAPTDSYTSRLFNNPTLLSAKLIEEAGELAEAQGREQVVWETADLMYFALTAMVRQGVTLPEVERELARRSGVMTRRPGNAKKTVQKERGAK